MRYFPRFAFFVGLVGAYIASVLPVYAETGTFDWYLGCNEAQPCAPFYEANGVHNSLLEFYTQPLHFFPINTDEVESVINYTVQTTAPQCYGFFGDEHGVLQFVGVPFAQVDADTAGVHIKIFDSENCAGNVLYEADDDSTFHGSITLGSSVGQSPYTLTVPFTVPNLDIPANSGYSIEISYTGAGNIIYSAVQTSPSPFDYYIPIILAGDVYTPPASAECSAFFFPANYICDALVFLFAPSEDSFDNWQTLGDEIKMKPPFGYFYAVRDELENIGGATTSAYTFPDIGALSSFFDSLRYITGTILWAGAFFWIYRRVKNITP